MNKQNFSFKTLSGGGLIRAITISLFATLACVGIIKAATTVGNNISTTGTITGNGANTLYGATSIGGALTATSTFDVTGIATFNNNVGIGTSSPYAKLSVVGEIVGSYFTATSTTAISTLGETILVADSDSAFTIQNAAGTMKTIFNTDMTNSTQGGSLEFSRRIQAVNNGETGNFRLFGVNALINYFHVEGVGGGVADESGAGIVLDRSRGIYNGTYPDLDIENIVDNDVIYFIQAKGMRNSGADVQYETVQEHGTVTMESDGFSGTYPNEFAKGQYSIYLADGSQIFAPSASNLITTPRILELDSTGLMTMGTGTSKPLQVRSSGLYDQSVQAQWDYASKALVLGGAAVSPVFVGIAGVSSGTDLADSSGHAITYTELSGGTAFQGSVRYCAFDGSNDIVTIADSSDFEFGTGATTIMFWINRPTTITTSYEDIMGKWATGASEWSIRLNSGASNGKLFFYAYYEGAPDENFIVQADTALPDEWTHVAIVLDPSACSGSYGENELKIYFNGSLQADTDLLATMTCAHGMVAAATPFTLGSLTSAGSNPTDSLLVPPAIYKGTALSASQIWEHYVKTAPMMGRAQ